LHIQPAAMAAWQASKMRWNSLPSAGISAFSQASSAPSSGRPAMRPVMPAISVVNSSTVIFPISAWPL